MGDIIQYKKVAGTTTDYPVKDAAMIDALQPAASGVEWPFGWDPATTAGLTFGYFGGNMITANGVLTAISAGTTALAASSTNYIESTRDGVLSDNASGFTAGRIPLFTVVTGVSTISSITDVRAFNQPTVNRLSLTGQTGGTVALSYAQARCQIIDVAGTLTSNLILEVPAVPWAWIVANSTTGAFSLTLKVNGQAGVTVPQGARRLCVCDGTDVRAMTGYLANDGGTLTGFLSLHADPTSALHAATKQYVDNLAAGLDIRASCRAATTANITLSGAQTIDGVSVIAGDRVLVKDQSTGANNGIYVCAAGAWSRATDADTSAEMTAGVFVWVSEGTTNADTGWVLTTNDAITLGSTALTFTQFTGVGQIVAGNGLTKSGPNTIDADNASETAVGVVELATSAETQAGTDTARAVTPAGLAAAAAFQGKQTLWIPAGAMTARTTNGAAAGTAEVGTGPTNLFMIRTLDFDANTDEFAQFSVAMPKSWDRGTVTAQALWSNASGTGSVVWGLQAVAISNDDVLASTFGTAQTVTDAVTAAGDLMISDPTAAITVGGTPALDGTTFGDMVVFQVYRDADNGSDTLAADARLHGIRLYITTNAKNDA